MASKQVAWSLQTALELVQGVMRDFTILFCRSHTIPFPSPALTPDIDHRHKGSPPNHLGQRPAWGGIFVQDLPPNWHKSRTCETSRETSQTFSRCPTILVGKALNLSDSTLEPTCIGLGLKGNLEWKSWGVVLRTNKVYCDVGCRNCKIFVPPAKALATVACQLAS